MRAPTWGKRCILSNLISQITFLYLIHTYVRPCSAARVSLTLLYIDMLRFLLLAPGLCHLGACVFLCFIFSYPKRSDEGVWQYLLVFQLAYRIILQLFFPWSSRRLGNFSVLDIHVPHASEYWSQTDLKCVLLIIIVSLTVFKQFQGLSTPWNQSSSPQCPRCEIIVFLSQYCWPWSLGSWLNPWHRN